VILLDYYIIEYFQLITIHNFSMKKEPFSRLEHPAEWPSWIQCNYCVQLFIAMLFLMVLIQFLWMIWIIWN